MSVFSTEPTRRNGDRNIKLSWVLGDCTDEDNNPTVATAQLSITHNSSRKEYTATISRVNVSDWAGFRTESFMIVGGTRVRLTSYLCPRFSAKGFESAAAAALAEVRARADEPELAAVSNPASPA